MRNANKSVVEEQRTKIFHPGDFAVYPSHGVGKIEAIEIREVNGEMQEFYIMNILEKNMVIMIPVNNVTSVGMRHIMDKKDVKKVFDILRHRKKKTVARNWNQMKRRHLKKIMSGDISQLAETFMDLYLLDRKKANSFEQKKLFNVVKRLLIKELCIAEHKNEEGIMSEIERIFES